MVCNLNLKRGARLLPFLLIFIGLLITGSCTHYGIEDRARKQMPVSLEYELQGFSPGCTDWRYENLKTIYVNDSICMLQFTARFHDAAGEKKMRDYRYIYLIDTQMSHIMHKPVFKEQFRNILCMPDKVIRRSRRETRRNKESVYEQMVNATLTIITPFDEKEKD